MSYVFSPATVGEIQLPLKPKRRDERVREILYLVEKATGMNVVIESDSLGDDGMDAIPVKPRRFWPGQLLGKGALKQAAEVVDSIELIPGMGMEN